MSKKIKGQHVLVICSGSSLKKYWNKVENFIKENDVITFGCNYITDFLIPDYHLWGSTKSWNAYGHLCSEKSTIVISEHFPKKELKKYWKGSYKVFKNVQRLWKPGSENKKSKEYKRCCVRYKSKKMFGCVRDIGTWAIFYAYIKGASKISVVGQDGYTLYSKKDLNSEFESQHCYGFGNTTCFTYRYSKRNDWFKYRSMKLLYKYCKNKYGFGFEIITPTIFRDFYNSDVLNIPEDPSWQKWEEPVTKEERNSLYLYKNILEKKPSDFISWAKK